MNKKSIYLFSALLLPALVFVFLKLFGKNEFAIPVYYENGIDSVSASCGGDYASPYVLPDSVLKVIGVPARPASVIAVELSETAETELNRLAETFISTEYSQRTISRSAGSPTRISDARVSRWITCVFFLKKPYNVVLADEKNRIRGYYAIDSREEMDRLILEMQILLKKY